MQYEFKRFENKGEGQDEAETGYRQGGRGGVALRAPLGLRRGR